MSLLATSPLSAPLEGVPLTVAVLGSPGLALDIFRQLLAAEGVVVAGGGPDSPEGGGGAGVPAPTVTARVDPQAGDWAAAKARGLPIVIVISKRTDDTEVLNALLAGAEAVLHGDSSPANVVAVLDEVRRGGTVLDAWQARALVRVARAAASQTPVTLSKREGEILASIARGEAVKQTARGLGISPKTVENIQSRLFRKLGVRNRAQAVARAHELGIL